MLSVHVVRASNSILDPYFWQTCEKSVNFGYLAKKWNISPAPQKLLFYWLVYSNELQLNQVLKWSWPVLWYKSETMSGLIVFEHSFHNTRFNYHTYAQCNTHCYVFSFVLSLKHIHKKYAHENQWRFQNLTKGEGAWTVFVWN